MDCYFIKKEDSFIIGNDYIERTVIFKEGKLVTISVMNKAAGFELVQKENISDIQFSYEGLTESIYHKGIQYEYILEDVQIKEIKDSFYEGDHLRVTFFLKNEKFGISLKRIMIIYESAPVIRTFMEVKIKNLPMGEFYGFNMRNVLDSLPLDWKRYNMKSVEFFTRTDKTNTLTKVNNTVEGFDRSSLIFAHDGKRNGGFFLLKESPCYSDNRPETDGNFQIGDKCIDTLGWGIRPEEFRLNCYMKTYGSVIGVFAGKEENGPEALKRFQRARAKIVPERDYVVMANPWGDRSCLEHMGEKFVLDEIKACSLIGATHYQLDDGWQKGGSLSRISANEVLEDDFWQIHEDKFTDGFNVITKKASEAGVELALWFAPDSNRLFRNHESQAQLLYNMYKKYGIRKFKIDGVNLRTKESEENLEKLLSELRQKTNGDITFNLDTTNNPRAGYFMFSEYGNIFLENRYTDWKNYYPWLTLKNLWDLAAYVPTQKLQIEFLNIDRNIDKYPEKDTLAPANYSYEYVFAITMFANPLCWFEPSSLGEKAVKSYSKMIKLHKKIRFELFECDIYPIGDRPSGHSWTGFQAHNSANGTGYFIIYRENNEKDDWGIKPLFLDKGKLTLKNIISKGDSIIHENYTGEEIKFSINKINDFKIYKYRIISQKV